MIIYANERAGWIYLVRGTDLHKIGYTRTGVKQRLSGLKKQFQIPLELIDSFGSEDVILEERRLHKVFWDMHMGQEWFDLPPTIIECREVWFRTALKEPKDETLAKIREATSKLLNF